MRSLTVAGRTCFFDSLRLCFQGAIDAAFLSLCLLVAIRVFGAPNAIKSAMVAFVWAGGLLSPFVTRAASRTNFKASHIVAAFFSAISACFVSAAFAKSLTSVLVCIAASSIFFRSEMALFTGVYYDNYSEKQRASCVAFGLTLSSLCCMGFGHLCGVILDINLQNYRALFLFVAMSSLLSGLFMLGVPTNPVRKPQNCKASYTSYLFRDKLFGKLAIYFTIIGFAYQMLIPIRIEYLANENYGLHMNNSSIMLLSCVLPSIARVLSLQLIGFLFDREKLIVTRLLVNAIFFAGIITFFNCNSFASLVFGSICLGIAMAGSSVMHGLWITKFAKPEMLPAYSSVYMMMTGVRSVIAPIVGYALLSVSCSPKFVGNFAALLLIFASIGFWSLRKNAALR
jgi:MFS family permease